MKTPRNLMQIVMSDKSPTPLMSKNAESLGNVSNPQRAAATGTALSRGYDQDQHRHRRRNVTR
jgi:hypothetical protein